MADKKKTRKNVRRAVKQKDGSQQYNSPRVLKSPAKAFRSFSKAKQKAYGTTKNPNAGKLVARAFGSAVKTSTAMKVLQKKRGK